MTEATLNGKTADIVAENVAKLRQLFPEIVTEDKIDFERLQDILGNYIEKDNESYRFTWHGKTDAFRKSQTQSTGTLRPYPEETESKNWETTENLYIEGDNLEVLKLLQKSYGNKVKMIYIDPPYNKDKDFVYPDKWSDPIKEYKRITGQVDEEDNLVSSETEEEGGRHTKWLNMMYPRLRLARNLLIDDGVIFISIDDDEVANLKRLCNDVFGEENFVAQIIWQNKKGGGNDSTYLAIEHEYILVYAKNKNVLADFYEAYSEKYIARYKEKDELGKYYWDTFKRKSGKQYYPIECPDGTILEYDSDGNAISWLRSKKRFASDKRTGEIRFVQTALSWSVQFKQRLPKGKTPRSLFTTETVIDNKGTTSTGSDDVYDYFKKDVFSNPKPVQLIIFLLSFIVQEGNIVMDFFSGSATLSEAVMKYSANNNIKVKYIAVQLPENIDKMLNSSDSNAKRIANNAIHVLNTIGNPHSITELAKERIRLAGEKIKVQVEENNRHLKSGEEPKQVPDIGFKVLKLDISNVKRWGLDVGEDFYKMSRGEQNHYLTDKLNFQIDNFVEGRSELDMVYEVMLKYGIDLFYPVENHNCNGKNVYSIGSGSLIICMDEKLDENLAEEIVNLVKEEQPETVRVVARDLSFMSDSAKTNFKETLKSGVQIYFDKAENKGNNQNQFEFITI